MRCKICKTELQGRLGKMFCSTSCKNAYHTQLRRVTKRYTRTVDDILHRNRSILLEIMGKRLKKKKVPRLTLDNKKFNYKYCTHFHINSRNKMIRYLYDFGWMDFSDDEILITRTSKNP